MSALQTYMQALFENEGGGSQAGMSLNNPYDLEDSSGSLESFPSMDAGETAAQNMLILDASGGSSIYSPSEPLSQYATTYAGGDPNAAANIGSLSGLDMSQPLSSLLSPSSSTTLPSIGGAPGAVVTPSTTLGNAASAAVTSAATGGIAGMLFTPRFLVGLIGVIIVGMGLFMFALSGIEGALGLGGKAVDVIGKTKGLAEAGAALL